MGNNAAGLYALTEEHEAIREAVRDIAEREIAPYAAEVDAESRFPIEAQKALTAAGFHATHIPEAYGGEGADAIATCIVIEEVARVDASASLIPAVNKLGSMPVILSASEDLKQRVLRPIAAGDAMISYGLSEREAGSDAAAMRTRARLDGDTWVLNGTKAWITNAGVSRWYTVMAVTDPEKGANGISAFAVHLDDPGFSVADSRGETRGLDADVVTMNTTPDVEFLADKGVVAKDWAKRFPENAAPTTSTSCSGPGCRSCGRSRTRSGSVRATWAGCAAGWPGGPGGGREGASARRSGALHSMPRRRRRAVNVSASNQLRDRWLA